MIPISLMVRGFGSVSFRIKGKEKSKFSSRERPVIAWNITGMCNMRCKHCYISAPMNKELDRETALRLIEEMGEIRIPLVILTGGEPFLRKDLLEIVEKLREKDVKVAISTNGTLINEEIAGKLADKVEYVGVSLDSSNEDWHDEFRGVKGAFREALKGIRNLISAGIPTGLRMTLTRLNVDSVPSYIDLALSLGVSRVVFYHLSATGRAKELADWYMTKDQYFRFMDYIIEIAKTVDMEIETTMAPFDGIYVAYKIAKDKEEFRKLLNFVRSDGIASIYPDGEVHPNQFMDFISLGNVRKEKLSETLGRGFHVELNGPKCSKCPFKSWCNGGDRARAFYFSGIDGDDPQCFLDVETIGNLLYDRGEE
ncbi:MAG: radical SAM protein [Candidatus Methanodesulfokora washburnensis]